MRDLLENYYVLDEQKRPIPATLELFALFCSHHENKRVALTWVYDGVFVSTVFLGLNNRFGSIGPPILFETITNVDGDWGTTVRYETWDEAVAGHEVAVQQALLLHSVTDKYD